MGTNKNKSSRSNYKLRPHDGLSVKPHAVLSARYNPKSLTELAANKIEHSIRMPQSAKPKSLVQLAAEKIEQSIKQPAKMTKPSKMLPTLKTLAAQALLKDKVNYWENKANNDTPINGLDKNTMRGGRRPTPIPAPRTKKQQPVAAPRTKIDEKRKALKGFTQSYEIGLKNDRDALVQLQNTRLAISRLFNTILNNTKGFKFVETLKVTFVKRKDDDNIYKSAYFNSRAQIVINSNDFLSSLQLSQQQILKGIGVWLSEGSGWTVSSINEHYINTVVYEPMRGHSYLPLPVKLQNSVKGLINLQNKDDECFRWCHIRYLNPQNDHPQRIKKTDRKMVQELNYQRVEFPVAAKHYGKIEEQNSININVFGYANEQFYLAVDYTGREATLCFNQGF